jgi:hypothetical protein
MARQAEAERGRRAKVIHAKREFEASQRLGDAAEIIGPSPAALQLRYLKTLTEVGGSDNSTIVFPLPIDLVRPFLDVEQPRSDDGDGHETQDEAPRSMPRCGFAASAFEEPVARRARLHRDDDCRQDSVGKPSGRRRDAAQVASATPAGTHPFRVARRPRGDDASSSSGRDGPGSARAFKRGSARCRRRAAAGRRRAR